MSYVISIDYLKDTRMRRKYSIRKRKIVGFIYPKGSPYRDDIVSSQLKSCINDATINNAPIWGGGGLTERNLYRQCHPRRVKGTNNEESEKSECVNDVIIISPILQIERKNWVLW